ncbi:MAG: MBL fold metallo-hydrolase RNA specificity domain-containing protein, partial [Planctomycetota bacterium]
PRIVKSLPTAAGLELIWSLWPGYLDGSDPVSVLRDEHNLPIQVIHTSGHATAEDLRRLAAAIDAKAVVPMHSFETHRFGEHISNVTLTSDREWFSA